MNKLIDSHCHLDYLERDGCDLDEIINNAKQAGLEKLLTISTSMTTFDKVYAIAMRYDMVYASVGVHPHEADKEQVSFDDLMAQAHREKLIAIGETGLDFYYNHSGNQGQIERFITHIQVAQATQKPLIVHTRDADELTIKILLEQYAIKPFKGLIHCFSSDINMVKALMPIGFYFSMSGILTFKSATQIQQAAEFIPIDKLLVETDAPFLAPIPFRGQKNQPAFMVKTAEKLAQLKSVNLDEIAYHTTNNFQRLFFK